MSSRTATGQAVPDGPYVGYRTLAARLAGHVFTGVWLLYLVAPVVDLITEDYSAPYRWGGVALIVAFSAIYLFAVPNWAYSRWYARPACRRWRRWRQSRPCCTGASVRARSGSSCLPPPGCLS